MSEDTNTITTDAEVSRVVSKPKKKKNIPTVISFGVLLLVISSSLWGTYIWRSNLKIQRIFIEGNRIVSAKEIVELTKTVAGTPLYDIDLNDVRENVLKQLYIGSATVVRELPNAVRIRVQERQPIAAISLQDMLYLDEEGVILPQYRSDVMFDVPFITGFVETSEMTSGSSVVNPYVLYALELLKRARSIDAELCHLVSEVHFNENGDLVLYSSDAGVTILFGKHDEIQKLVMLKTFWNKFVPGHGATLLQLVDLRYSGQVIARWKDSNNEHRIAF